MTQLLEEYNEQHEAHDDDSTDVEDLVDRSLDSGHRQYMNEVEKGRKAVVAHFTKMKTAGKPVSENDLEKALGKIVRASRTKVESDLERNYVDQPSDLRWSAPLTPTLFRKFEEQVLTDMDKHLNSDDEAMRHFAKHLKSKKPQEVQSMTRKHLSTLKRQRASRVSALRKRLIPQKKASWRELEMLTIPTERNKVLAKMHERNVVNKELEDLKNLTEEEEQKKNEDWTQSILDSMETDAEKPKFGESVDEDEPVVDLTESKASKKGLKAEFHLGEGYSIECGMVSFTSGNQHGCYEAVTIKKHTGQDPKTKQPKRPVTIVLPIRALKALYQGIVGIRNAMATLPHLPTLTQLSKQVDDADHNGVDLSSFSRLLPKLNYKIDEVISMKSEKVKWGKAVVEVISFSRMPKDAAKSPFTLQVPATLFNVLEQAVTFIYRQKFGYKSSAEEEEY